MIDFIALIKDDYISQIDSIATELKLKDCEITSILKTLGVITGKSNIDLNFLKIDGIVSIEKQRLIKI